MPAAADRVRPYVGLRDRRVLEQPGQRIRGAAFAVEHRDGVGPLAEGDGCAEVVVERPLLPSRCRGARRALGRAVAVDAVEDRDPLVTGVVDEDPRQVGVGLQVLHRAVFVGEHLAARRQAGDFAPFVVRGARSPG